VIAPQKHDMCLSCWPYKFAEPLTLAIADPSLIGSVGYRLLCL